MKKDLTILFGLFGIVAAILIYQGVAGGSFLYGTKIKSATSEAKVSPKVNLNTTVNTKISNLKTTEVKILRLKVTAEVADTQETRAFGLGGRETLAENAGMLFVFETEAKHSFWMKNVGFGLDIIWMDKNKKVIHFVKDAKADTGGDLEIYTPPGNAKYVLEVNGGSISKYGISLGKKADFDLK